MSHIQELAAFYKEDLFQSLRYSLKGSRKRDFDGDKIYNVSANDLITDRYDQIYDPKDRSKHFKFNVEIGPPDYKLSLTKRFFINGVFQNDLDFPSQITLHNNKMIFTWCKSGLTHRSCGPAHIEYNTILDTTYCSWYCRDMRIPSELMDKWLESNDIDTKTTKLTEDQERLLKLQLSDKFN